MIPATSTPGQKVEGKPSTHKRCPTKEEWDMHLLGTRGLGIVPINEESMCRFGAIDIDEYPIDLQALNVRIQENGLPLVVCRTKSGGAHLYLFTNQHIPAKIFVTKLKEMASVLGYGGCEIYPRQVQLLVNRGDIGSWINLPYFGGDKTMRYALDDEGNTLGILEFIKHVYTKVKTPEQLMQMRFEQKELLPGGPPCLQRLVAQGFPQGTRHNGLLNLGIYLRKAYPGEWEKKLEEANRDYMEPPLSSSDVLATIKSLNKTDYNYTCRAQPINNFCDSAKCRTCQHGVGGSNYGMPRLGTLTKLCTDPPIWFIDIETATGGFRMELLTEDLQNPVRFQLRCMECINVMPQIPKRQDWTHVVAQLMETVAEIEVPEELTPFGQLKLHIENFCTSRVTAKTKDEILLGKPWVDGGEIHFRMQDLSTYLDRVRYRGFDLNHITAYISKLPGARRQFHNLKGKGTNVWVLSETAFEKQTEKFDVSRIDDLPI